MTIVNDFACSLILYPLLAIHLTAKFKIINYLRIMPIHLVRKLFASYILNMLLSAKLKKE